MHNYTKNSKIYIIIILITNIRFKIFSNINNFILIYYCQITKIDNLNKDNINNIS